MQHLTILLMMENSIEFILRRRKVLLRYNIVMVTLCVIYRFWNNEFIDDLLTDRTARNLLYVEACCKYSLWSVMIVTVLGYCITG